MVNVINSVVEKLNQGVNAIIYTMAVIGNADNSASLIFDHKSFNQHHLSRRFLNNPEIYYILNYYTRDSL